MPSRHAAVAAPDQFDVFSFVPEIEVVFFETPAALERVLGTSVPPETIEVGRLAPRKTLTRLLAGSAVPDLAAFLEKMDEEAIELFLKGQQLAALAGKVRSLSRWIVEPVS